MKRFTIWLLAAVLQIAQCYATDVIGRVAGSLNVNETGGATYTIPINLLSAANEYSPNISLVYNSQAGNGLAGFGWNLAGLSSISIRPRNVYFDSTANGLQEGRDNAYYLDGMRLLLVSGENGRQGAVYRTESEKYSIISIDSVLGETPATFTVRTVDGSIYRYGSQTGRAYYSNNACYEWALDYAEDQQGNYITYTYSQSNLVLYPTSITYGRNKHNNGTPLYTISFYYSSRTDKIPVHYFGVSASFDKRLSQITCKSQNSIYRRYNLSYETNVYSHLTSVREIGLQSSSYPATTFVWQNLPTYDLSTTAPSVPTAMYQTAENTHYYAADTDNDGRSELMGLFGYVSGQNPFIAMQIWKHNGQTGNFQKTDSYLTQNGISIPGMYETSRHGGNVAHISERSDNSILLPYIASLNGRCICFHCLKEEPTSINYPLRSSAYDVCYTITDVDKNGMDEIVLIEQAQITGGYAASILRPNLSQAGSNYPFTDFTMSLAGVPKRIAPADYDGDGMVDLLICTTNGYYIYWNNAGVFSDNNRYYGTDFSECDVLEIGDFNADGQPDLVLNMHNSASWKSAINQGNKTTPFSFYTITDLETAGASNYDDGNEAYCLIQDYDGDGKSDLLVGMSFLNLNHQFLAAQMLLLKSTGANFTLIDSTIFPTQACFPTLSKIVQGDFDGDGIAEIMYYGGAFHSTETDVAWRTLKPSGYTPASNRITSITDGLGNTQKIDYKLLTDSTIYTADTTFTFPLLTLRTALPVVKRIKTISGNDSIWSDYTYKNAIFHWQGKGLLGFKERTILSSTGTKSVISNAVNEDYYVLYNTSEASYASNQIKWWNRSRNTYFAPIAPNCYSERCCSAGVNNLQSTYREYHEWSDYSYGVPSTENNTGPLFQSETEYTFWDSSSSGTYVKNLPIRIETSKEEGSIYEETTERTEYTRDNTTGLPLTCKKYRNNTLLETTLYAYNTNRQLISQTVIHGNSTDSLTTTYTYGTNGRISQTTDPMGHTTQYFYNTYGLLTRDKNYLNINTYYTYDDMLRLKKRYNTISSVERTYDTGDYGNAAYKIVETRKGQPTRATYYDAWERKIADAEQRFNGQWLFTDYRYLENGEIGFESFPHTSWTVSDEGTFNTYDCYSRLTAQTDNNGKTSTWTYNNHYTTTSTIDGVTRQIVYAGPGIAESMEDSSGDVIFERGSDGRPVTILLNNDLETNIDYDDYGRISQTTDMQGITRSYTYDANGYPLTATQGTSTHTTLYDKYGRMLSETYHDANASADTQSYYTYNNKNQLLCDSSSNHVYTYEYDTYGRLKKEFRKVMADETESMTCTYTYNANNQVSQKDVVLGRAGVTLVEKYTYANGWCTAISLNDTLVWRLNEENSMGLTQKVINHMDTQTWGYDDYGHLLSQTLYGTHNQGQSYSYNLTTGNLTQKGNDNYTYDGLNRLAGWNNTSYSYDDLGNLLKMEKMDTVIYNGFRVSSATTSQTGMTTVSSNFSYLKSMERPLYINEGGKNISYSYDGSRKRVWMKVYNTLMIPNSLLATRYYVGDNYEVEKKAGGYERHYYYVGGTPYDAPAVVLVEDSVPVIYQMYRDHLGSITMYASQNDSIQLNYYPWGNRYRIISGNAQFIYPYSNYDSSEKFFRTYTGHEEIPYVGLLNTNARLYNPYMGRFYSPDPLLATEGYPMDFNPYVYARNNPMSYVDQDGEFPWLFIVGALIGGAFNVACNWDNINNFGDGFIYFGVGAAASIMGTMVSPFPMAGIVGGALNGLTSGAVSGFFLDGGNAVISGGNVWKSAWQGAWQGGVSGIFYGALSGGIEALVNGNNIWNGTPKYSTSYMEVNQAFISNGELGNIRPETYIDINDPYYQQLLKEAQARYPKKAGHMELHHIDPQYMGGLSDGQLIEIDAAYHQMITNEFRKEWKYGNGKLHELERHNIMRKVYSKYPLPFQNKIIFQLPPIEPIPFPNYQIKSILRPSKLSTLPVDIPQMNMIIRTKMYNR